MIEIKSLSKTFTNFNSSIKVLNNISHFFPTNGLYCIIGKSGSGKSTLLNILGALEGYDTGDILIDGISTRNQSKEYWDEYRCQSVGFVFQDYNLIHELSVKENIILPLRMTGQTAEQIEKRYYSVIQLVNLVGFEKRNPASLSGGERQRAAIARAIIKNPKIILADEPTGNLDEDSGELIWKLLRDISKTKLVIVVTHDKDSSEKYANEILPLVNGEIPQNSPQEMDMETQAEITNQPGFQPKLPFSYKLSLAYNNFHVKRRRLVFVMLSFFMSLCLISFAYSFFTFNYGVISELTFEANEIDQIEFLHGNSCDDEMCTEINAQTMNQQEKIQIQFPEIPTFYSAHFSILLNQMSTTFEFPEVQPNWYSSEITGMMIHHSTPPQELRFGQYSLEGNKVVISDYLATMLLEYRMYDVENISALIDMEFNFVINDLVYHYIISGIFDTDYEEYLYSDENHEGLYVPEDMYSRFLNQITHNYMIIHLSSDAYRLFIEDTTSVPAVLSTGNFAGAMFFYQVAEMRDTDIDRLIGNAPSNNDEFVILLSQVLQEENITLEEYDNNPECFQQNWLDQVVVLSSIGEVDYPIATAYSITGILDDVHTPRENDLRYSMYLSDANYASFLDAYQDTILQGIIIFPTLNDDSSSLYNTLTDWGYEHTTFLSKNLDVIHDTLIQLTPIIYGAFFFLMLLTEFSLFSFFGMIIDGHRKQIGILYSIGIPMKDCSSIFILESIMISLVVSVMAIPASLCLFHVVQSQISSAFGKNIILFYPDGWSILFIVFIAFFLSILSTFISLRRIANLNPIDSIRFS